MKTIGTYYYGIEYEKYNWFRINLFPLGFSISFREVYGFSLLGHCHMHYCRLWRYYPNIPKSMISNNIISNLYIIEYTNDYRKLYHELIFIYF